MLKSHLLVAAHLVLLALLAEAQSTKLKYPPTGFVTERLSVGEKEKWKAIEQIVFAEDTQHQALHPTLRNLWQWVETSGHTIFIEFINSRGVSTCTAGLFTIERFDPLGDHHIAVIKLNLNNINLAYVGAETRKPNGFVPFRWLEKEERYAEVLGHELAHTVHILTNLKRAQMVEDIIQQTNQMLLAQYGKHKNVLAPDLKRRLLKRDNLLKVLEEQAEEMEKVVWMELVARKTRNLKLPYLANQESRNQREFGFAPRRTPKPNQGQAGRK
ncbi:MAG: hypothetical protein ACRD82_22225 [Blastocatellia bacterium]